MNERDGRGVIGWLVLAWVLLAGCGLALALEINRGQAGFETPVEAMYSIRDSLAADANWESLPLTLDYWAPQESDFANLDLWLHGLHTNGDSTYAKTCQDTLRIGRVYR